MATTITGKLNKAASQFQAGESVGFGLRIGVKHYDRETKQEAWTNYQAAVFAKAPAQVQFYQQALVEGAIVEVSGDKLAIKQFQGQNGLNLSIEILDAKLGFVFNPNAQPSQQPQNQRPAQQPNRPQQAPQQGYNQAPNQRPAQQGYNQAPQQNYGQAPQQAYNQPQQAYNQPQQAYNQPQQGYGQAPQQGMNNGQPPIDFEDDIPF